ncbi:MAG: hybrid sensor histidine kinase/response regulator [Gammaproteobacteria bacterium]
MIEDTELRRLFKEESEEHLARLDNGLLRLEKTPNDAELLDEVFRESHSLKGAARMLGLGRIEAGAHELESILNAARKGNTPITQPLIERMNAGLAELRRRVHAALDEDTTTAVASSPATTDSKATPLAVPVPKSQVSHAPTSYPAHNDTEEHFRIETVRVETRKLDELLTQVGELSVIQGQIHHRLSLIKELAAQWTTIERYIRLKQGAINTDQCKELEMLTQLGNLLKQTRETFDDDHTRLESTVHILKDQVSNMRLLPFSTLFGLFPRMVRDLSNEQSKEVELILEGGDITVDKRILEEMKDPLMHLIRNAIDHGVESTEQRSRLGKPDRATLTIRALREEAHVLLEVSDDGCGLDPQSIRTQAGQRGIVEASVLSEMTPLQLQQLIFTSGFSTSRYITELSGRGVGLDVVRANVERLKGNIHLESAIGRGLTVQLRLPVSLATTRLLLAQIDGRLFGLPVEFVHSSLWVREEALFMLEGHPAIQIDAEPVIVVRLAKLLELERKSKEPELKACVVLLLEQGRFGLLVDDLPGEEEVVLKALGAPLKRIRNISALALLSSGAICPVLNAADLECSAHKIAAVRPSDKQTVQQEVKRHTLLLVEDSALIRAMEQRILEDANYEVVTAVDGVDALNRLAGRPFDALVTDIVMPNMDGLSLTERVRADARYRDLPVILVTSLASDNDKKRGLDVGANAYIPKPTFDQRTLIETLKRLI